LFGVAMIPLQSVDRAVEEMKFARQTLGKMCIRDSFAGNDFFALRKLPSATTGR